MTFNVSLVSGAVVNMIHDRVRFACRKAGYDLCTRQMYRIGSREGAGRKDMFTRLYCTGMSKKRKSRKPQELRSDDVQFKLHECEKFLGEISD